MIIKEHLEKIISEVYDDLMKKSYNAEQNSKDYRAPESYIADQKGYSRGLSEAASIFWQRLSEEFG